MVYPKWLHWLHNVADCSRQFLEIRIVSGGHPPLEKKVAKRTYLR